ncbi:hypothetical protein E3U23_01905 [Erythrobacter litoralis]|uniref:regulatory protein RecX n=1 Tax=Erythrobacter litoralis TaxID=39960 RepID=UPI0024352287|nr:RecX family transcriptional regulator [Erythrobacter litoralis]MDG6077952.1 hypothetical protein [Erythrobacter litoralis]
MGEPRTTYDKKRRAPKPLDPVRLNDLALAYVARFATTAAKLQRYLIRKIRQRGWEDETQPDIDGLVARFVENGYVDDAVYGRAKAGGLVARGYGERRVEQALRADGIDETLRARFAPGEYEARGAIQHLARRRKFGPFGQPRATLDREAGAKLYEKQLAAMIRAGHNFEMARRVLDAATEEELDEWVAEASDLDYERRD